MQTAKGLLVIGALVILFLATPFRRDVVALAAAGILLSSRRMASREILGLVDWHLPGPVHRPLRGERGSRVLGLVDLKVKLGRGGFLGAPPPAWDSHVSRI